MNDIIHLLPDSVANQIAAGEVVQRPSSIIKEMVENSIDAGAKNVKVLVTDGGKTNVQVIDDGKGMSETDARLSFERHATSKIQKASDLFSLTTMGFRGEALASIAAVAQVELKTRRREDELGTMIQIAGSRVEKQEPVACPAGSNFSVQNLFYNVPARRKFLKSNQTELTNVVADFQRIVLVHPEISFTLYNNGVEMYNLPEASVRQRIIDVFGKKINADLLPIEVETSLVSISGYVGKPESSKKKGAHQYFFVNGRYMRHPYFHSAVMKAYENLLKTADLPYAFFPYYVHFNKILPGLSGKPSPRMSAVRAADGFRFDVVQEPSYGMLIIDVEKINSIGFRFNPSYKMAFYVQDLIKKCFDAKIYFSKSYMFSPKEFGEEKKLFFETEMKNDNSQETINGFVQELRNRYGTKQPEAAPEQQAQSPTPPQPQEETKQEEASK